MDPHTSCEMTENLQESSQLPYTCESSDILPAHPVDLRLTRIMAAVSEIQEATRICERVQQSRAFPPTLMCPSESTPGHSSEGTEVVINVHEASASFNNDPHGSQLRSHDQQTSIAEQEIDKIFSWQSRRLHAIDRTPQSEVSVVRNRHVTSTEGRHVRFLRKVKNLIQNTRKSKYFLLWKFILFAVLISAFYMGVKYEDDCPVSEVTPFLLELIGGFGIALTFLRIATVFKNLLPGQVTKMMKYVSVGLYWCLGITLCFEMIHFYSLSPDFESPSHPGYCLKTFYYYTFYMNIAAAVMGFLVLLINIPCFRETTEISYIRMV